MAADQKNRQQTIEVARRNWQAEVETAQTYRDLAARERDEKRIALSIDLHSAVTRKRFPQRASMLSQRLRVTMRAQLMQQPGRTLDVGEEECNRAGGQIAHYERIPRSRSRYQSHRPLGPKALRCHRPGNAGFGAAVPSVQPC